MQLSKHTVQSDWQISRGKTELCTQIRNNTLFFFYYAKHKHLLCHSFTVNTEDIKKVYCIKNTKYKAVQFTVNASTGSQQNICSETKRLSSYPTTPQQFKVFYHWGNCNLEYCRTCHYFIHQQSHISFTMQKARKELIICAIYEFFKHCWNQPLIAHITCTPQPEVPR